MEEPSYQSAQITRTQVYQDLMWYFKQKITNKNLAYSIMNLGYLSLLIKDQMAEEFDKYGGFGSQRGYATFTRRTLIGNITNIIETRKIEIAYHKIINSRALQVYKDSILYRPGTKRVEKLKKNFEAKSNKP